MTVRKYGINNPSADIVNLMKSKREKYVKKDIAHTASEDHTEQMAL